MQIGIVGAGKVGCSIGKYLKEANISVIGYYSKTYESAKQAADFTNTQAYQDLGDLVAASDTLYITTPDDCIRQVWDYIAQKPIQNYIICHMSGSLSSDVFSGIEHTGAFACSIHPMFAFSNKFTAYQQLNTAVFTMEGQQEAVDRIRQTFITCGNKVIQIQPQDKSRYHAAASIVSNHMLGLMQMGIDELMQCGFSEQEAYEVTAPLVRNNIEAMLTVGCEQALTGPIERGDCETVRKHLAGLSVCEQQVYCGIGQRLLRMAKQKHPERNYQEMEKILEEEK